MGVGDELRTIWVFNLYLKSVIKFTIDWETISFDLGRRFCITQYGQRRYITDVCSSMLRSVANKWRGEIGKRYHIFLWTCYRSFNLCSGLQNRVIHSRIWIKRVLQVFHRTTYSEKKIFKNVCAKHDRKLKNIKKKKKKNSSPWMMNPKSNIQTKKKKKKCHTTILKKEIYN